MSLSEPVALVKLVSKGKRSYNQHSKFGEKDVERGTSFLLLPSSRGSVNLLSSKNKYNLPKFSSSKVSNMSYYSAYELDDDKKDSLKTKRSFNPGKSILDQTCENEIRTLTLAEARDVIKKFAHLLHDFQKLNKITSVTEEICLKEVYLLLLNLKNADFNRSLNPHKFSQLFRVLDIDLTEE